MKRLWFTGIMLLSTPVYAVDLLTAYQTAAANSPILRQAAAAASVYQAKADVSRGSLLPGVSVSAGVSKYDDGLQANTVSATLSQTLFNINQWETWQSARQTAQSQQAIHQYSMQQFIFNLASAYFTVLQSQDAVNFADAQVASDKSTLNQTKEQFAVGLATIADVKQAEANYEQAVATQLQNQDTLNNAIESLAVYTGTRYTDLSSLKADLPFALPNPNDINYWVSQAKRSNWNLESQRLATDAARQTVIAQGGSMLPSISLQATYANNNFQGGDTAAYGLSQGIDKEVAIVATWNIFQTPAVSASADSSGPLWSLTVKQQKLYEAQQANEDYTLRALVASVRQDYLNVVADSQSVKAYQQSVISGQASLAQYQAQYKVGTQTLTAVLQQVQNLYQAKQNYSQAQYKYITDLLQLKLDAGTLSVTDVQDLNQWLQG